MAVAFERAWKNHKPTDIAQKVLDEKEGRERAQLKLLHNEIILIWDISEEHFIKEWNVLQIGRHGTARGSAPATWVQKEGAFGELMLCKPMIIHINNVAPDDLVIYEWEPDQLIIQILQGTTRRYKVLTLLECVIKIHDVKDELVSCTKQNRITTEAWSSLTQCIGGYILEGVSAKAKEQTRQITTLLSLLNKKPELICTGYEVLASQAFGSEIRIDMAFKDQRIVIEIEGLPTSKSKTACTYLKERYMIKFKTLEQWLCEQNCQLILMVPAGTQIPADQQDEINKDQTIIIWKDQ
ncbi:MAG TPA: hypothetical protein VFN35_22775 [Ktedonobacteraceae bacterium]|nr:hypothetical protein [Ktedonobacteraceae bacterium]